MEELFDNEQSDFIMDFIPEDAPVNESDEELDDLVKEQEKELEELKSLLLIDEERAMTGVVPAEPSLAMAPIKKSKETFVRISNDQKEAWLYLAKPIEGECYTRESVMELLEENGIQCGYIMSNIIAMVKKGVYERAIKVAVAADPIEGHDGYYEYGFDADGLTRKTPKVRADGSVDYTSMNLLANVSKDSVIATYYPAAPGTDGYLIDGTVLTAKPVKDLPELKGKGFYFNEETNEYFAQDDGKLDMKGPFEINIGNVHQIKGDVTQLTGVIEFYGDIEIDGNVEAGAVIRSAKTITISGTIEAAEIYAGGDIVLKRGIQGSNLGKIVSGGTVYAEFIEHTTVKATNVNANAILNSQVFALEKVNVAGKKGAIIGGYVHARKGINVVNLGNTVEVKTVVHVGLEEKDYQKNQEIMKEAVVIREKMQNIVEEMTDILNQKKIRPLTKDDVDKLNQLNAEKKELMEAMKTNMEEEAEINKIIEASAGAEVRVEDHVYKGSVICIDAQKLPITQSTMYMSYQNSGGLISGSVIVR